ncbi:MAG: ABC transporter substrate-binding protein [Candidatus Binatia bacterium]
MKVARAARLICRSRGCSKLVATALLVLFSSSLEAASDDEWKKILGAAKKEGRLAVSVHTGDTRRNAVMKFQEAFPDIRLEISTDPTAKYIARVRQERRAGVYAIDVRVGGPRTNHELIPEGVYVPLRPAIALGEVLEDAKWLGGFAGGFSDREKKYSYSAIAERSGIIYLNRDFVAQAEFSKVDDILNPKWKGRICMRDPRGAGSGNTALNILLRIRGEEFVRRLLLNQEVVLSEDNRQLTEWIVRGRYPIAAGLADTFIEQFKKEGLGLNIKELMSPEVLHISLGGEAIALVERGPHPNAAKLFANWFLSREGQSILSSFVGSNTRRLDVPVVKPDVQVTQEQYRTLFNKDLQENEEYANKAIAVARRILK